MTSPQRLLPALVATLLLASISARSQTIVYVNQASTNTVTNGMNWTTAFHELRDALASSKLTNANGVEVWVAAGTYHPTAGTDQSIAFGLSNYVILRGGFTGTETSPSQRPLSANGLPTALTVLSGDIGTLQAGTVTAATPMSSLGAFTFNPLDPGFEDNSYNVVKIDPYANVTLDGFIITGGDADVSTNVIPGETIHGMTTVAPGDYYGTPSVALDSRVAGGGVFNVGGTLTVENCIFINNGAAGMGGALANQAANVTCQNTEFFQNYAGYEGGAFWGQNENFSFSNCLFNGNTAGRSGGGAHDETLGSIASAVVGNTDPYAYEDAVGGSTLTNLQEYLANANLVLDGMAANTQGATPPGGGNASLTQKLQTEAANELAKKVVKLGVKSTIASVAQAAASLSESEAESAAGSLMNGFSEINDVLQAVNVGILIAEDLGLNPDSPFAVQYTKYYNYVEEYTGGAFFASIIETVLSDLPGSIFYVAPPPAQTYEQGAGADWLNDQANYDPFQQDNQNVRPPNTFINCQFVNNQSEGVAGGLMVCHDDVRVLSTLFQNNWAAVSGGGAEVIGYESSLFLCDGFNGNSSLYGHSGLVNAFRTIAFDYNCTFVNNVSDVTNGFTLDNEAGASVVLGNSIFWNNSHPEFYSPGAIPGSDLVTGADIFTAQYQNLGTGGQQQYNNDGDAHWEDIGICDIRHCEIQGLFSLPIGSGDFYYVPSGAGISAPPASEDANATYLLDGDCPPIGSGNRQTFTNGANENIDINPQLTANLGTWPSSPGVGAGQPGLVINSALQNTFFPEDESFPGDLTDLLGNRFTAKDAGAVQNNGNYPNGQNLYVNQNVQGGSHSGLDWADALTSIPANPPVDFGAAIWVAQGTYKNAVTLPAGVSIYGGFAGNETSIAQSDPVQHPTILTGPAPAPLTINGTVVTYSGAPVYETSAQFAANTPLVLVIYNGSQAYAPAPGSINLMTVTGGDAAVVHGLTFTGFQSTITYNAKSALYVNGPTTVEYCLFSTNNCASSAVFAASDQVSFLQCQFIDNIGTGALFSQASSTIIRNCRFDVNQSVNSGAACDLVGTSSPENMPLSLSFGSTFGGLIEGGVAGTQIWGSEFYDNSSQDICGAIYSGQTTLDIENCTIVGNTAYAPGGASGYANISALGNYGSWQFAPGGAGVAYWDDGFWNEIGDNSYVNVINSVLYDNVVKPSYSPAITDLDAAPASLWAVPSAEFQQINTASLLKNCIVQGLASLPATNSSSVDPLLNHESSGWIPGNGAPDWYLEPVFGSPTVDAGTSQVTANLYTTNDLAGNPRIYGNAIDIGAFEYQYFSPPFTTNYSVTVSNSTFPPSSTWTESTLPTNLYLVMNQTCSNQIPTVNVDVVLPAGYGSGVKPVWEVNRNDGNGFNGIYTVSGGVMVSNAQGGAVSLPNGALFGGINSYHLIITNPPATMQGWQIRALELSSPGKNGYLTPAATIWGNDSLFYVNVNATGSQDGSSWSNAFIDLREALEFGVPCGQIWVAQGTYSTGPYTPPPGTVIYGGFAGTETSLAQRNWQSNQTILQSASGSVLTYTNSSINNSTVLDGFYIEQMTPGPAVTVSHGAPQIQNCIFLNAAQNTYAAQNAGSAMFTNCLFENYGRDAVVNSGQLTLEDCVFATNFDSTSAGALLNSAGATAQIQDSRFLGNAGKVAGAIDNVSTAAITMLRCQILGNTSSNGAGGIYIAPSGTARVENSLFARNSSFYTNGGALAYYGHTLEFLNCTVYGNTAGLGGAGVYLGGSAADIWNSIFYENRLTGGPTATAEATQVEASGSVPTIQYSLIEGLNQYAGRSNIGYVPLFADDADGNFHLSGGSPAIDAGSASAPLTAQLDLDGNPRAWPGTGIPDMGAYEFQGASLGKIDLISLTTSASSCGDFAQFKVVGAPGTAYNYQWFEHNGGSTFLLTNGFPNVAVAALGVTNTLDLYSLPSFTNATIQLTINGYEYSPILQLTSAQAQVLYVNGAMPSSGDGLTWQSAYKTVQEALSAANGCGQIWVQEGTYAGGAIPTGQTLTPQSGVQLYGGFNGTETLLSQRNVVSNRTILIPGAGSQIITANSSDNSAVLDGFTITGAANVAAVQIQQCGLTLQNCVLANNKVAVAANLASGVVFDQCLFESNQQTAALIASSTNVSFTNCQFADNSGSGDSSLLASYSTLFLEDCIFTNNTSTFSNSSALGINYGSMVLDDSLVAANQNSGLGAPITANSANLSLRNDTIAYNSGHSASAGLLGTFGGSLAATNCIFWYNITTAASTQEQSQISVQYETPTISRSIITGLNLFQDSLKDNSSNDPVFFNPGAGNYELISISPAIGDGSTNGITAQTVDPIGNPRLRNGVVDLGAYAYNYVTNLPGYLSYDFQSESTCSAAFGIYDLRGDPLTIQWQVNNGAGFVNVVNDAQDQIIPSVNGSSLTVTANNSNFTGGTYRYITSGAVNFTSPAITLDLTPRDVIYVDQNAHGAYDGSSWANAYNDLSEALASANKCDNLWIAQGTYSVDGLQPVPGIDLIGGFPTGGSALSARNPAKYQTSVFGQFTSTTLITLSAQEAYGQHTTLDGLYFEAGGTGLQVNAGSPIIQNCDFFDLHTTGINAAAGTTAAITNCTFIGSSQGLLESNAVLTVEGCDFVEEGLNYNEYYGSVDSLDGAAAFLQGGSADFVGCQFAENDAWLGGAVFQTNGTAVFLNCLFDNNMADQAGGAVYSQSGSLGLTNCTVANNQNYAGNPGGGLIYYSAAGQSLGVANCIFWGNSSDVYAPNGGFAPSYDLFEYVSPTAGSNILNFNPLFQNSAAGNFMLDSNSPAINAGNNALTQPGETDLAGYARIQNGTVDLGAYESPSPGVLPVIAGAPPVSQTVCAGGIASFQASGNSSYQFQWQYSSGNGWTNLNSGALLDGSAVFVETNSGVSALSNATWFGTMPVSTETNSLISTLTISNVSVPLTGLQFQAVFVGQSYTTEVATLTVSSPIVYVDASAASGGDGTAWAKAFRSMSPALASATESLCGHQVWVAQGNYASSQSLFVNPGLQIYGGFPSGGGAFNSRNWQTHPTILSTTGTAVTIQSPADTNTILDGFIIEGTQTGVEVDSASPTLQNLTITGSSYGGMTITESTAASGVQVSNCVFSNNVGGLSIASSSGVMVARCLFTNNQSVALDAGYANFTVANCQFENNSSSSDGGAMDVYGGLVTVNDSSFAGNTAQSGGAVFESSGTMTLRDCLLDHNTAQGPGGDLQGAGGAVANEFGALSLINCTVADNVSAAEGAGVASYEVSSQGLTINNSILWNNNSSGESYSNTASAEVYTQAGYSAANDIFEFQSSSAGANILLDNPLFGVGYLLETNSPAINAGNNAYTVASETDLAGNARIQNTTVDLGAYESAGAGLSPLVVGPGLGPVAACATGNAVFQITTSAPAALQWQYNQGYGWTNLNNGQSVGGVTASITSGNGLLTLTLPDVPLTLNGLQVQLVSGATYTSSTGTLTVQSWPVIYVDASAPNGGDGMSWATAFNNLGTALSSIGTCNKTIWVAQGIYSPSQGEYFNIPAHEQLYGGFPPGGGTRNPQTYPTILSGGSITVVITSSAASDTVLDGFTVKNATQAGIEVNTASPTLQNLVVTGNGQAGLELINSPAHMTNCWFEQNAGYGASLNGSDAVFVNCGFQGNDSVGLYAYNSQAEFLGVLASGNLGAMELLSGSYLLENATVSANEGSSYGPQPYGGIYLNGAALTVANSIFWNNRSSQANGGTIENQQISSVDSSVAISYTTVEGLAALSGTFVTNLSPAFLEAIGPSSQPTTNGDFQLAGCSPLINAGNNSVAAGLTEDLAGQARIIGGTVDLGAYEYSGVVNTPLLIVSQPQDQIFSTTSGASYTVAATGDGLTYDWEIAAPTNAGNFSSLQGIGNVSGANNSSLTLAPAFAAVNGSLIRCQITTSEGCVADTRSALLQNFPVRYYVNTAQSNDLGDGLTWATAFQTITHATQSPVTPGGTQIWVAAGAYQAPAAFAMQAGDLFYGGFVGTETNLNQRNWIAHPVIIQGMANVAFQAVNATSLRVDGFQITNAFCAVYCYQNVSNFVIANCAVNSGTEGLFMSLNCSAQLTNCSINNCSEGINGSEQVSIQLAGCAFTNDATAMDINGGAVAATNCAIVNCTEGIFNYSSTAQLQNCVFIGVDSGIDSDNNSSATFLGCSFSGGSEGIGSDDGSVCSATGCTFTGEQTAIVATRGPILIANCAFTGNQTGLNPENGCQVTVTNSSFTTNQTGIVQQGGLTTVAGCAFSGNNMGISGFYPLTVNDSDFTTNASGVEYSGSAPFFRRCVFRANGSGSATAGAIELDGTANAQMVDCLFIGNQGSSAGALLNYYSSGTTLRNCTFGGNSPFAINNNSGLTLYNSILWDDAAELDGQVTDGGGNDLGTSDAGFVAENSPANAPSTNGDYHLSACSPLLHTGLTNQIGSSATDLDGQPRIQDGAVDPGAYESDATPLTFTSEPANASASLNQPVSFTAVVSNPTNVIYSWQVSMAGGAYTNLAGAVTNTLTLQAVPALNGNEYRMVALFPSGCTVYSQPAVFSYYVAPDSFPGVVNGVLPASGTNAAINFTIAGGVNNSTLTSQSVAVYGMESGRLDYGYSVAGGDVTLDPTAPLYPGEVVSVTVDGDLKTTGGAAASSHTWEFTSDVDSWDGQFAAAQTVSLPGNPPANALQIGELNGQKGLDLFVSAATGCYVLTNDGSGHFADSGQQLGAGPASKIVLADLRGSGHLDALLIRNGALEIWTNSGAGQFSMETNYASAPIVDLAVADLNSDGALDLFLLTGITDRVWWNNGAGQFTDSGLNLPDTNATSVALADFNGDGMIDAFVVHGDATTPGYLWLNQGGSFALQNNTGVGASGFPGGYQRVTVANVNADNNPDLILFTATFYNQGYVEVYTGDGNNGYFLYNWEAQSVLPNAVSVGDVNGDRLQDLVYANPDGDLLVYVAGGGSFQRLPHQGAIANATVTALGDLNGDGALDMALISAQGNVAVALYQPTQLYGSEGALLPISSNTFGMEFGERYTNALLGITISTLPTNGTLYLSGTTVTRGQTISGGNLNSLSYQGAPYYFGSDQFVWEGVDGSGVEPLAYNFNIALSFVAHDVIAVNDYMSVGQLQTASRLTNGASSVLDNDTNYDPGTFIALVDSPPANGSLQLNSDGTFTYTQNGSATHSDYFTYWAINTGTGESNSATVYIDITNVDDAPATIQLAQAPVYEGQAAGLTIGQLSATGLDPAVPGFAFSLVSGDGSSGNGYFSISNNVLLTSGPLSYAAGATQSIRVRATSLPDAYDDGGAYSEQEFSVTVLPLPVASPQSLSMGENSSPLAIQLTGTGLSPLTCVVTAAPTNGILAGTAPNFLYRPNSNFVGSDSLSFYVTDGVMTSAVATVSLSVYFVDEAPTGPTINVSTMENSPVNITLAAAPFTNQTLSYAISFPPQGSLRGFAPDITYTPPLNFSGHDGFYFTASDGTLTSSPILVNISVIHVNQPPVAYPQTVQVYQNAEVSFGIVGSDVDSPNLTYQIIMPPRNGILESGSSTFSSPEGQAVLVGYLPTNAFIGTDSFQFVASDGQTNSAPATVTIDVVAPPLPVANSQVVYTPENQSVQINLSGSDPLFGELFYYLSQMPSHGTLAGPSPTFSPTYLYIPAAGFYGADSFKFGIEGTYARDSALATVTINVGQAYQSPTVAPLEITNYSGIPAEIQLEGYSAMGSALTYQIVQGPTNGSILASNFPDVTYLASNYYSGPDSFTYQVSDGISNSAVATVSIEDLMPPHFSELPPPIYTETYLGVPITVAFLSNAIDPWGLHQSWQLVTPLQYGIFTAVTATNATYLPTNASGEGEEFSWSASNGMYTETNLAYIGILPLDFAVAPGGGYAPYGGVEEDSLADAIALANSFGITNEIDITLLGNMTLSEAQTNTPNGDPSALAITGNIRLIGYNLSRAPSDNYVTISVDPSAPPMRLFQIAPGGSLALTNCVLTGGTAQEGGAIYNEGMLQLYLAALTTNTALADANGPGLGGAIYNHNGAVLMTNSEITNNIADLAGGIYQVGDGASASLVASNCVLSGHGAAFDFYSTNDNGGTSSITSTLLSVQNPTAPWFSPLASSYAIPPASYPDDSLAFQMSFNILLDPAQYAFSVGEARFADAFWQIFGSGSQRTLGYYGVPADSDGPFNVAVTATGGGISYTENFSMDIDPTNDDQPVAQNLFVAVPPGGSVTFPLRPLFAGNTNSWNLIGYQNGQNGEVDGRGQSILYINTNPNAASDSFTYTLSGGSTATVNILIQSLSLPIYFNSDSGSWTLRDALATANQYYSDTGWVLSFYGYGGNIINPSTIGDTADGPSAYTIAQNIIIDGSGVSGAGIAPAAGAPAMRLFHVTSTGSLTLTNFSLSGGSALPGSYGAGRGGAIFNEGALNLNSVAICSNSATGDSSALGLGGGIFNLGTVLLNSVDITNNVADNGGGIYQIGDEAAAAIQMTNSVIINPNAGYDTVSATAAYPASFLDASSASTTLYNSSIAQPSPPSIGPVEPRYNFGATSIPFELFYPGSNAPQLFVTSDNYYVLPNYPDDTSVPDASFSGSGALRYLSISPVDNGIVNLMVQAVDGPVSFGRSIQISVLGAGVLPPIVPSPLQLTAYRGAPNMLDVITNDYDLGDAPLTIISVSPALNGSVLVTNNQILYINNGNTATNDAFTYVVTNNFGGSASGLVKLTIVPAQVAVTTASETGPGSIREAFATIASIGGAGWTIVPAPSLAGQTITLSDYYPASGEYYAFWITNRVSIDGGNAPGFTIAINQNEYQAPPMRPFKVAPGGELDLANLTLINGQSDNFDWGAGGFGGSIYNQGTINCTNVTFSNNTANGYGGSAGGGAICNDGGLANIYNCLFTGNTVVGAAPALGGAILNRNGTMLLSSNTFEDNSASLGASVYNLGDSYAATNTGAASAIAALTLQNDFMTNTLDVFDFISSTNGAGQSEVFSYQTNIMSQGTPSLAPIADQVISGAISVPIAVYSAFATPNLSVSSANQAAVANSGLAVSANDGSDSVSITPGQHSGRTQVSVQLSDGGLSYAEIFNVTVIGLPTASNQTYQTTAMEPITFNVLANALGNGLSVASYQATQLVGTLTNQGGGTFTYNPDDMTGRPLTNTFTCTLSDVSHNTTTITVTILVIGQDVPPVVQNIVVERTAGQALNIPVAEFIAAATDLDYPNSALALLEFDEQSTNFVTLTGSDGFVIYPDISSTASDSFNFIIGDPIGGMGQGTAFVAVAPTNFAVLDTSGVATSIIYGLLNLGNSVTAVKIGADIVVQFIGTPGQSYLIQYSDDLENWTTAGAAVAGENGILQARDLAPAGQERFYRLATQ